ncbi:MAG: hypothetical protein ACQEWV_14010 [Bacillota bacterium]
MTALIGKKFDNGVLIMADKRITYRGTEKFSDDVKKIIALNKNVILAFAGVKNIIDLCIEELKTFSLTSSSLEEIAAHSQKLFTTALMTFKKSHPKQDYATVYILAGFNENGEPFVSYFSSDNDFQKSYPLEYFYKTFPNTEMVYLRHFLKKEVDNSRTDINYYIHKFSSAIRQINNKKVSKNTFSLFLSQKGVFEVEINEEGVFTISEIEMN